MTTSSLPRRCCLCLQCRTALFPGQSCDCSEDAQVACFEDKAEREKIVSAAWGSEDTRRQSVRILDRARQRIAGASMGGLAAGVAVGDVLLGFGPSVVVSGVVGAFIGGTAVRRYGSNAELEPKGRPELRTKEGLGLRATLLGAHDLVSPATGHACLAYCIELRVLHGRREWVMFRDSVTSGFVAKLGTGEKIRVPAGRLRFAGQAPEVLDVDNIELEAYLEWVDPQQAHSDLFRPLHFNLVREEMLFAGDQVDLLGDFHRELVNHDEAAYRESLPTYLRADGIPEVRLLR